MFKKEVVKAGSFIVQSNMHIYILKLKILRKNIAAYTWFNILVTVL